MITDNSLYIIIITGLYVCSSFFWGIFSAMSQKDRLPTQYKKIILSFILNFIFMPFGVLIAVIRFSENHTLKLLPLTSIQRDLIDLKKAYISLLWAAAKSNGGKLVIQNSYLARVSKNTTIMRYDDKLNNCIVYKAE